MVRVVVLDLDDTLYPESQYAFSAFAAVGRYFEKTRGVAGLGQCAASLFVRGARQHVYDIALESLGIVATDALVNELVELHRHHPPAITLFADAERFIRRAEGRGFSLALVTDGWLETQRLKVKALSLEARLNPLVFTDAWGREAWKPSPRGFEAVMARHGGRVSDYIYVGDNPAKDFVAPRALGWRTLRIRRPGSEYSHLEPNSPQAGADSDLPDLDAVDLDALAAGSITQPPSLPTGAMTE